jgi:c(7)-type cytochrome triheme protein
MKKRIILLLALAAWGGVLFPAWAGDYWDFPPDLPPDMYGNILIDRASTQNGEKPVIFSHWVHRVKYTCRVCHSELEFNFEKNGTYITEADNKAGKYCGACHDGITAFGHTKENCPKCHNGDLGYGREKFKKLAKLEPSRMGNKIDWNAALDSGKIKPVHFLKTPPDMHYAETLVLEAEWTMVPPAIFPHKKHTKWLDCNNCHPEIFNIKKKTTKHFLMEYIKEGQFCGVCHLSIAFPMTDCGRCHPKMEM